MSTNQFGNFVVRTIESTGLQTVAPGVTHVVRQWLPDHNWHLSNCPIVSYHRSLTSARKSAAQRARHS